MKATIKKFVVALVVMAMVLSIGFDAVKVFATTINNPVGINEIRKTADEIEEECRTYEVFLEIDGTPPQNKPVDVVLVIDTSTSMNTGGRMAAARTAATTFANEVLGNGNPNNNRISIVNYGTRATQKLNWTNNVTTVNTSIAGLAPSGTQYTNIHEGFILAEKLIDTARAEATKVIIMMSDGGANRWMDGPNKDILRFTDDYPTSHNDSTNAAWNKGLALQGKANIFTIGLFTSMPANQKTIAIETLEWSAPSGQFKNSVSTADLEAIYASLAGVINHSATNAVITDEIGENFEFVPGSFVTVPAGGSVSLSADERTITWNPGSIGEYASLKYKVKAKDDFAGGEEVPTNEWAKLEYKDLDDNNQSKTFPIPVVDVSGKTGSIEIVKQIFDEETGELILDDDTVFDFNIAGANNFSEDITASVNNPGILDGLVSGIYMVTEIHKPGYHNQTGAQRIELVIDHCSDENVKQVIFKNDRKSNISYGSLEIEKIIKDTHGELITEGRSFKILLTGPSYPYGEEILINNSVVTVIDNLIPGEYTVEELDADYFFEITIDESPVQVANNQLAKVTITNKEKKIGELTVNKILLGKDGEEILEDEREFKIRITGPNGYNESIALKGGESETLIELEYGEYTAIEENDEGYANIDDYVVSVSGSANLTYLNRKGSITVTNKEKEEPNDGFTGDIEIIKKVEFREKELEKLGRVRDLLNGLFRFGAKSEPKELADGVDQDQIDEAEDLIDSLLEFGVQDFAKQFINQAQYLLDNPPYLPMMMLQSFEEAEPNEGLENKELEETEEDTEQEDVFEETDEVEETNDLEAEDVSETPNQNDEEEQEEQEETDESDSAELKALNVPVSLIVAEPELKQEVEKVEEVEEIEEFEEDEESNDSEAEDLSDTPNEDDELDEVIAEEIPQARFMAPLLIEPENLELENLLENADLSGFEFVLYELVGDQEIFKGKVFTDGDGMAKFEDMPEGNYIIREILEGEEWISSIGEGYRFYFNVDTKAIVVTNTVDDEFNPNPDPDPEGRIVINKIDRATERPLSGARFEVRNMDGELVDVMITNSEGLAFSRNLPFGQYSVEEILAPSGYILNSDRHYVSIESEEGVFLTVSNRRRPTPDPEPEPEDPDDEEEFDEDPIPETQPDPEPELPEEEDDIIIEEPVPEAEPEPEVDAEDTVKEEEEVVEEPVPEAKPVATLPKTGAASPLMTTGFGTLLLAAGLFLRRKRR